MYALYSFLSDASVNITLALKNGPPPRFVHGRDGEGAWL